MRGEYDVVIIGAGIHGAGCAQAAAAAGHSVLLLEQTAIAAGSSSRSSKLIHGGLRYLETGQFRLVRESLHERTTLLRLAPDLVRLQRFHLPVYRSTRRQAWQLTTGLALYAALAGFARGAGFGRVPRRDWERLDGLATAGLRHVLWYHDAQTDDALLARAVVRSAQQLGAELALPARYTGARLVSGGVEVRFATSAGEHTARARVLVNTAGPWATDVARRIEPAVAVPAVERVQGAHLVVPGRLEQGIYYVESPRDGRAVFVMPWRAATLIGTTETRFRGDPAGVAPQPREVAYLMEILRHYFPRYAGLQPGELLGAFAGLRVLPAGHGHAFHRSRETLLTADRAERPRVLSVYGGKLTTWRSVAARVLERIAASLPARKPLVRTDQIPLRAE
ncbi:MAG: FAD-dependent oxidoreductase [Gammaproteobacteria bacterium]|nr:FAD-dependent oxidoreductase [Gammaproteobacteria bacterium]